MITNPEDPYNNADYDPFEGLSDDDRIQAGCLQFAMFILMMAALIVVAAVFGSCTTTRYVDVERVKTDTCYVVQKQRDSIYVEKYRHDSVFIQQRGDTVFFYKWLTVYQDQWRDRVVHDSIYLSKTDTLNIETIEVREKPLTLMQHIRMWVGTVAILLVGICFAYFLLRRTFKKVKP